MRAIRDTGGEAIRIGTDVLLHQPIGRLGRAEELAQAVVWLCSQRASPVTGTALVVDSGHLAV